MLNADCFLQIRHLDCRLRCLEALVAHLQSRPVDCLLEGFAGEDAEGMWHSGLLCRLSDAARDFIDDDVVVRSVAAQKASDADDGVVFSCFRQRARGGRNLESAGSADDIDCFFGHARAHQSIERALQEPLSNEGVESRDDNAEAFSRAVQITLKRLPMETRAFIQFVCFLLGHNIANNDTERIRKWALGPIKSVHPLRRILSHVPAPFIKQSPGFHIVQFIATGTIGMHGVGIECHTLAAV